MNAVPWVVPVALVLVATSVPAHDLSSDWSQFLGGPERVAAATNEGPAGAALAWSTTVLTGNLADTENPSPVIHDGVVYMGYAEVGAPGQTSQGKFYAYDLRGEEGGARVLWAKRLNNSIEATPAVVGDTIYAAGLDFNATLYALKASDGSKRWEFTPGGFRKFVTAPAVADGTVYVLDSEGTLWALRADTGTKLWSSPTKGASVNNAPAVSGDSAYLAFASEILACDYPCSNDKLVRVDRTTGAATRTVDPTDAASTDDDLSTTPAVAGGFVLVASQHVAAYDDDHDHAHPAIPGRLFAIEAATGAVKWTKETAGDNFLDLAVADGIVYAPNTNGNLYAYDLATGGQRWSKRVNDVLTTSVALAGDTIYVGSITAQDCTVGATTFRGAKEGKIHALRTSDGSQVWSRTIATYPLGAPAVGGGYLAIRTAPIHPAYCVADVNVELLVLGQDPGAHASNHAPTLSGLAPTSDNASPTASLAWTGQDADAGDALLYDVYFGTTSPPPLARNLQAASSHAPGTLSTGTTYHWRVVAHDGHGGAADSGLKSFTVAGDPTSSPTTEASASTSAPTGSTDVEESRKDSPGLGPGLVLLAALACVVWRRRR